MRVPQLGLPQTGPSKQTDRNLPRPRIFAKRIAGGSLRHADREVGVHQADSGRRWQVIPGRYDLAAKPGRNYFVCVAASSFGLSSRTSSHCCVEPSAKWTSAGVVS
jgi:hypothetical protein